MPPPKQLYEIRVTIRTEKIIKVKAVNRESAIRKANKHTAGLGWDVTIMRVPFLEGDD